MLDVTQAAMTRLAGDADLRVRGVVGVLLRIMALAQVVE
jgi:hypothetical protein